MNNIQNINKIYFNCKRGILELDIILLNFLEYKYAKLTNKLKIEFCHLLEESDQNLYIWIIKNVLNKKYTKIIKRIKYSKKTLKVI